MTVKVQDFAPQEKKVTATSPIRVDLPANGYFTGSIANLSTTAGDVIQALVDAGGSLRNFFIRAGDRMNFVNQRMSKISIIPSTATSTDSSSGNNIYTKMYGKIIMPETDTEEMHLASNSWVEYVQGGSVLLQGTVTVSIATTTEAGNSLGGTTSSSANTYTALEATSTLCNQFQVWYPKSGASVLSVSMLGTGTTASRVAELSPQQGFAYVCNANRQIDLSTVSVASTGTSDTYDAAFEV